jgi:hypothetical protein
MDEMTRWRAELEQPSEAFFEVFAAVSKQDESLRDAVREAAKVLCLAVDWEAYLPHVPHGLLGLRAAYRLRPHLSSKSFLRLLATQLHAFAHEGRRRKPVAPAQGAGLWKNLESFITARKPALAHMEAHSFAQPGPEDFARLGVKVASDMAIVGHKSVMAHHMSDLFESLDRPKATGRRLFAQAAWMAATPEDAFWHQRAAKRLPEGFEVPDAPAVWSEATAEEAMREMCDLGLVELLNRFAVRVKEGATRADLLTALVRAAAEKQLDARRDLEGKTGWNFVYLATHALRQGGDARLFAQAAAMVNLFPTDDAEGRIQAKSPEGEISAEALTEAILDAEPAKAMGVARALAARSGSSALLAPLAEAASANDPAFNHAHQTMMVASAADLLPFLPEAAAQEMLAAMAKSLANNQGSSDLGRKADRALAN